MIGVACSAGDLDVAREFFELFKTPWEPAVRGRRYSVVLANDCNFEGLDARVFLAYGTTLLKSDAPSGPDAGVVCGPITVTWDEWRFPLYGSARLFQQSSSPRLLTTDSGPLDFRARSGARLVWRLGYDLFAEVRHLLKTGQPAVHAQTPTLELHVAVLRQLLLEAGVPFAEVPPRPFGYDFACCLTHDVDFHGFRRHMFDRTLAGFVVRASVLTLIDWVRGRRPLADVARNWQTLGLLPLVFARLRPDFWRPFDDYRQADRGWPSTYFVVPFKGRPGLGPDGTVSAQRAVAYQASEIAADITAVHAAGSELAVHGIDAWRDADAGRAEMSELTKLTGQEQVGIRMHWLYFADDSPKRLEHAGFDYDSTVGYNDAVGFRAGTSQAFRLPGTAGLLELPLAIMDSALLSPDRMALAPDAAAGECRQVVKTARRFGGTVVINWHCRSLAPERLWRRPYEELLDDVESNHRAWFATTAEAANWFRWRRSLQFSSGSESSSVIRVQDQSAHRSFAAIVRVYRPAPDGPSIEDLRISGAEACVVDLGAIQSTMQRVS